MKHRPLEEFAGTRTGRVAIIANGESINDHNLGHLAGTPIITMNRSWEAPRLVGLEPDYHVVAEPIHYTRNPDVYVELARKIPVFCPGVGWSSIPIDGYPMPIRHARLRGHIYWGDDCAKGVGLGLGNTGTVAYGSLQVAAWLGFNEILMLGLDLRGPHFHGEWPTDAAKLLAQRPLFEHAAKELRKRGIQVFNVGSPLSLCEAFPRMSFAQAFP